jgi:hypothetical protein
MSGGNFCIIFCNVFSVVQSPPYRIKQREYKNKNVAFSYHLLS